MEHEKKHASLVAFQESIIIGDVDENSTLAAEHRASDAADALANASARANEQALSLSQLQEPAKQLARKLKRGSVVAALLQPTIHAKLATAQQAYSEAAEKSSGEWIESYDPSANAFYYYSHVR